MSVCNKIYCINDNSLVARTTYLVDIHAHTLEDHHHRGLIDSSSFLVKSIKTFLQRIHLVQNIYHFLIFIKSHDLIHCISKFRDAFMTSAKTKRKKKFLYILSEKCALCMHFALFWLILTTKYFGGGG